MSAQPENFSGGMLYRRGKSRRMSTASVSYKGINLDVQYTTDGSYLPATDIDDACYPMCNAEVIEHMGDDIKRLLSDEQVVEIEEQIELSWRLQP